MDMSSSNPLRSDPLPDWLQPFDEHLVDEEEQRVDRVEVYDDIQARDQVRERERESCCTRRKSSTATSTQASQSAGGSGTRTDAHPYRSWCVHCVRGAGRSDAHRRRARHGEEEREQHMTTWSIDYAFMNDNGDMCTREEMERVGWERYSVGKRGSGHRRNPCTSCLGRRKRRPVDSRKDQGRY